MNACINNLRQIDGAIQQWALETKQAANAAVTHAGGLVPYLKSPPICPRPGPGRKAWQVFRPATPSRPCRTPRSAQLCRQRTCSAGKSSVCWYSRPGSDPGPFCLAGQWALDPPQISQSLFDPTSAGLASQACGWQFEAAYGSGTGLWQSCLGQGLKKVVWLPGSTILARRND